MFVARLLNRFTKRLRRDEVLQVQGLMGACLRLRWVLRRLRRLVMGDGELGTADPSGLFVILSLSGC